MIVVAATIPLRYLVAIDREHLLPTLYGRVLIPPAVAEELNHNRRKRSSSQASNCEKRCLISPSLATRTF
jgi:predicted nucleic acid-binding protein